MLQKIYCKTQKRLCTFWAWAHFWNNVDLFHMTAPKGKKIRSTYLILRIQVLMMTYGCPSIPDSPAEMDWGTLQDMQIAWQTLYMSCIWACAWLEAGGLKPVNHLLLLAVRSLPRMWLSSVAASENVSEWNAALWGIYCIKWKNGSGHDEIEHGGTLFSFWQIKAACGRPELKMEFKSMKLRCKRRQGSTKYGKIALKSQNRNCFFFRAI